MFLRVNLGIAKIQMLSRKRQTIIAILGVTFGIAMFILMISFMKGTNQFLQDAMLSSTPDIHIYNDIKTNYNTSISDEFFRHDSRSVSVVHNQRPKNIRANLKNAEGIIADIKKNSEVVAVSPVLSTQVFFNYGAVQLNGVVDGVNITEEASLYNLNEKMKSGRPEDLLIADNGMLLGQGLANKMNVHTGDVVSVTTASGTKTRFKIAGIFQFGIGTVDNIKGMVTLSNAQRLLGKDHNYITDLHVKLKDLRQAKQVATTFANKYKYKADDWQTTNSSVLASTIVRNVLTWVVTIALLIVAGFGIYNIMNMTIANKLKEIAILRAQGFRSKDIVVIFLSQSLFIGLAGALLGILLGFFLSYTVSKVPFPQSDLISLKYFPVLFKTSYYLSAMGFGIFTTLVAGLMPSIKASKLDPITVLRG